MTAPLNTPATLAVITDVLAERHRQHARWGEHLDRAECRTVDPPPSPLLARFLRRLVGPQWVRR